MRKIPRKFVFLFIILAIIIIAIPTYYVTIYFNTKINVVEKFGISDTNTLYEINNDNLNNYELNIVCNSFDISDDFDASYEITIPSENISGKLVNNRFSVKLALASNWISKDAFKASSSRTIDMRQSSNHKQTFTITDLGVFAERKNYLVPFPKPTLYVLVTYSVEESGTTKEYNDLISYEYGEYKILTGGFEN